MKHLLGVVIFEGGTLNGTLEGKLQQIRNRLTIELIKKCIGVSGIDHVILVSNYDSLQDESNQLGADVFDTTHIVPFHFGQVLAQVSRAYDLSKVIVFSGGSVPLMTQDDLLDLVDMILKNDDTVIANNPQSADVIAFSPAKVLQQVNLPEIDNPLPWILREEGKLSLQLLPIRMGFNFDVDTLQDLIYLSIHPLCPVELQNELSDWISAKDKIYQAMNVMQVPNAEILLTGRVGPWIMSYLNEHVPCRLRVISEERGMKALGRIKNQQVYSFLGEMIDTMGMDHFFRYLETHCQVAFMDTRVLFSHWKLNPDSDDRFYSDLGQVDQIKQPMIKALTEKAAQCRIPVILGGHSVISGGMMVMVDAINRSNEKRMV